MFIANKQNINCLASASTDVDDAVGVSRRHWFIAIVNNRSEKTVARKLSAARVENYLPTQQELHIWNNGKKSKVDRVLIPSKIFIHCTEHERRELVKLPYIFRFMTNIAGAKDTLSRNPLAIVTDDEIDKLKFMIGASNGEVQFTEHFTKGQKIEVVRGPLKGLSGEIAVDARSGVSRLYVNINCLGSASVVINPTDVRHLHD